MYRLILKARAIATSKEAYEWYEEQQTGLGDLFLKELDSSYDKIEKWPSSYAKIKKDFRQIILKKFPYVVFLKF